VVLWNFYLFNGARQSRLPVFGAENAAESALTYQRFSWVSFLKLFDIVFLDKNVLGDRKFRQSRLVCPQLYQRLIETYSIYSVNDFTGEVIRCGCFPMLRAVNLLFWRRLQARKWFGFWECVGAKLKGGNVRHLLRDGFLTLRWFAALPRTQNFLVLRPLFLHGGTVLDSKFIFGVLHTHTSYAAAKLSSHILLSHFLV